MPRINKGQQPLVLVRARDYPDGNPFANKSRPWQFNAQRVKHVKRLRDYANWLPSEQEALEREWAAVQAELQRQPRRKRKSACMMNSFRLVAERRRNRRRREYLREQARKRRIKIKEDKAFRAKALRQFPGTKHLKPLDIVQVQETTDEYAKASKAERISITCARKREAKLDWRTYYGRAFEKDAT